MKFLKYNFGQPKKGYLRSEIKIDNCHDGELIAEIAENCEGNMIK